MYFQRSYLPATPRAWSTFIHLRQSNKCQHASKPCFHLFIALYTHTVQTHIVQVYLHKLLLAYFVCFFVSFPLVCILYCIFVAIVENLLRLNVTSLVKALKGHESLAGIEFEMLTDNVKDPGVRFSTWVTPHVIGLCLTLNTVCLAALRSLTCIVWAILYCLRIWLILGGPYALLC